jgi:hypothetical protein
MSVEEAILKKVRRLKPEEQEEVLRFADGLEKRSEVRLVPSRDRSREMKWLEKNRAKYAGQWVVIEGDGLIAVDGPGVNAYEVARAAGIEVPFLIHVPPEDPLPFIMGWL